MANTKISALSASTTPLAGTEVLPIVQSSTTKKTAVSTIKDYILGLANTFTANQTIQTTSSTASKITIVSDLDGASDFQSAVEVRRTTVAGGALMQSVRNGAVGGVGWMVKVTATNAAEVSGTYTNTFKFDEIGNLIPQIAAKGINFTANTPASGMTSQLLNWYEEGTWTPTFGGSTSQSGQTYDIQSGNYIKMGKYVFATFDIRLTALGTITGNVQLKGLPYTQLNGFAAGSGVIQGWSGLTTSYYNLLLTAGSNSTTADFWGQSSAGTAVSGLLAQANLSNTTRINGSILYIATT